MHKKHLKKKINEKKYQKQTWVYRQQQQTHVWIIEISVAVQEIHTHTHNTCLMIFLNSHLYPDFLINEYVHFVIGCVPVDYVWPLQITTSYIEISLQIIHLVCFTWINKKRRANSRLMTMVLMIIMVGNDK